MKKILLIFISIFLLCQNVFADNLGDAITAWKNLVSTVKGITYSVINSSLPIKDVEQWKALMNEAINNQADTLSVTIVIHSFPRSEERLGKECISACVRQESFTS